MSCIRNRNERTLRMPDSPNTAVASVESPSSIVTSPLLIPTSASATRESGAAAAPQPPLSNGLHATSPNQPISPGVQLPPTCGARQLSKLKRFLTTLQQFGSDISPEIGERVRGLIVNLVNNAITVEDFHQQLQDTTNFPLRPFVIPFLKANLPLLQQELVNCAHLSKRSPGGGHYMPPPSIEPLSERERERIKTEVEEFGFERPPQPSSTASQAGEKRKPPPQEVETRPKENGHHLDAISSPNNKRKCLTPRFDVEGNAFVDQLMENLKNDTDEWRNVETMLQYISTFVEKAKRSISVLQERCIRDREEMANWARAMAADAENEIKRRTEAVIENNTRTTDERMNEMKRFAEDAVTDVKRQAVVELQKAVNAAEEKANDALNQAQQHKEQALLEARRQAAEEAIMLANQQENSKENCWNCGRKANETCSGCSVARYCGSFCQHKDWDKDHHKECQKYKQQTQQQQQEAKPKTPPQEQQQTAESRREQQQQQAESRRVIEINKSSDVRSTSPRPVIVTSAPIVTQSHTNIAMSEGPVQASSSAS